ncbi:hypothetical protein BGZ60DRAFT_376252 [Tricladium varicosporioides]|nr:hypothetical protein BGZ60DRAFT_376252 [Hymenoscyphus varicosporioides]
MASPLLLRSSSPYVCAGCAFRAAKPLSRQSKRNVGMKYLSKVADAEMQWQQRAGEIHAGKRKSMLTILEERGLVQTVTGTREEMDRRMTERRLGAYVGIDPTAASLHVGHLLPFMSLFWMYLHGYHTVSLLGGATAKIGDPTDRLITREKDTKAVRNANMVNMHYQLKKLWLNVESTGRRLGYFDKKGFEMHREVINNNAWWNKLPMLEVLQTLGPGMRMGSMLARDTVKNKMEKGDGMSFAEFSYPIMQAWDWWHMYSTKGINMQIGGNDQFGNITAGIDAVKYLSKTTQDPLTKTNTEGMDDPIGFTVPLLTTSSGQKFGKSAGNAIWLDGDETSVFDLYGYFLKTSDADVGKYLKLFTFLKIEDINAVVKEHQENPKERKAQHTLAREIVTLVHGPHEADVTEKEHRFLFAKKPHEPAVLEVNADADAIAGYTTLNNRPKVNIQLPRGVVEKLSLPRLLFACGLVDSASEGNRLARDKGAYIGGMPHGRKMPMVDGMVSWTRIALWKNEDTSKFLIDGNLLMFRRGKNKIKVIEVLPDEEYRATGQVYPGRTVRPGNRPVSNLERRSDKILETLTVPTKSGLDWEARMEKERMWQEKQMEETEIDLREEAESEGETPSKPDQ